MNFMNTHALVASHLRDELINCSHICGADHEEYLKCLSEKGQKVIALIRKKYLKGAEPWYPLPRQQLGKLLYDIQISKEIHMRMDQARQRLPADDLVKEEEKIVNVLALKYGDRVGKMLNIVDPRLGEDWLARVWALIWGTDSWATLEKLNLIDLQDAPVESKILWVSLLESDKITRAAYGLKLGDLFFRLASTLLLNFVDMLDDVNVPLECTISMYFEELQLEARAHLFPVLTKFGAKTKDAELLAPKKEDVIPMAAQRLLYRFFCHLKSMKHIVTIPIMAKQWTNIALGEGCMYPKSMQHLSEWELGHCPW
ncbi:hypothetical protein L7F22_006055 [Adiantum nelumboides]|nr:hypothetical protein [Adiantum nelumboides]